MQSNNFEKFLASRWSEIYSSPDSKFIFRGDAEKVEVKKTGSVFVLYNESLKKKRSSQIDDKKQNVFQTFDSSKFNFNKVTAKEILFYVNIDNEQIVSKEKALETGSKFLDDQNQEADQQSQIHPIIVNTSPTYRNHSILVMFPQSQLPQVVGQEVLLLVLILFKLSPQLVIGFNSIGAASTINHLHFHLLYPKDITGKQKLPIQNIARKMIHKTSLVNPKQQINMYSVGVIVQELIGFLKGYVLTPLDPKADQSQIFNSLSFVFGLFINEFLDKNIPHNIIIADRGKSIYILPRKFSSDKNQTGWLQLSGVAVVKDGDQFNNFSDSIWRKTIQELQMEQQQLQKIKKVVIAHLKQYS